MPETVPLSVVVITRNEAARLADCLESVRWAGEIVVVDDESTDETVAVARRYTDRVIRRRMEIEGVHRNFAYDQARHDWILSLDADERVTPELRDEILRLLRGTPQFKGYTIPRRNYLGSTWVRHGGWYPSPQLRLFRKESFRYEEVEVHPRAFMNADSGQLRHDLIHYSYRDLADFLAKLNRQTTLEARKWLKDGRRMPLRRGLWRFADRSLRTWWVKKGYRDGSLGFIVAAYAGLYQFLSYAKYWHLRNAEGRETAAAGRGAAASNVPPGRRDAGRPAAAASPSGPRLSAVILTKDAAVTLPACLESIRWVDQIVVVDGGSTDDTLRLAREAGAAVVTDLRPDDFAALRNVGTDHATGDWVLQLDADEVVTPEFRRALEGILSQAPPHAAFKFRRQNLFLGRRMRFGGWDHDSLHLFRRGSARYEGRVHEQLRVQGSIGRLRVGVVHSPFRSLEEFIDRQNRYTSLEALQLTEAGPRPSGRELDYQIRVKSAKLFWKLYVRKQGFREGTVGVIFCVLYAFVHLIKWAKVWEICSKGGQPCAS